MYYEYQKTTLFNHTEHGMEGRAYSRVFCCNGDNPFQWPNRCINLPGDSKYSPKVSGVSKLTKERNLTAELWTYIDKIKRIVHQKKRDG